MSSLRRGFSTQLTKKPSSKAGHRSQSDRPFPALYRRKLNRKARSKENIAPSPIGSGLFFSIRPSLPTQKSRADNPTKTADNPTRCNAVRQSRQETVRTRRKTPAEEEKKNASKKAEGKGDFAEGKGDSEKTATGEEKPFSRKHHKTAAQISTSA